ncbi:16S rRNA (guanine(527)-N(7))-methyltransferase RsmG [Oceanobacter mangrovi]|uniref:16S rRNA (guanine(527)-N(7))-methyltransferase RsmG n=1 Tax=Oceanobacter mangrovi TaxID=2862510 RepID=UPI001C8EB901|nr:16S rRNA (guanine(527)-N(7))-methyltransferase RsmG [Oceanobacter mangrovi]
MADHSVAFEQLQAQLADGAQKLGISLSEQQLAALMEYLQLLIKWNKAYNLTAIRDPREMVALHLLDSLAVDPLLGDARRVIDVGTGPGFPGIVLAIMNPQRQFDLLDSNGKKTRFMFQVKTALKLANVTIINDRVEAYHPSEPFDIIVSRAFASLQDMVSWCRHLVAADGCFLAMKGLYPEDELAALPADIQLLESVRLEVPGVDAQRHVLRLVAADQSIPS